MSFQTNSKAWKKSNKTNKLRVVKQKMHFACLDLTIPKTKTKTEQMISHPLSEIEGGGGGGGGGGRFGVVVSKW